jgi:crotonobetainyl-CoA:carnitine CoA-transferase CaiB-like acyl-CoA transferase
LFGYSQAIDAALAGLTRNRDADQLAQRLGSVGVPAAKSATSIDVIADQLLWERGPYRFVTDHHEGQRPIVGPSWRMSRDPGQISRGAPNLGEDTEYVLHEILRTVSQTGSPP